MIVGLGYNIGVGKDSAAQALCRDLGYRRVAFADKLRELAFDIDPLVTSNTMAVNVGAGRGRLKWLVQGVGWEEAKRMNPEVRLLLQNLGSAGRRLFGQDFWVDQALRGVKAGDRVVVADVRYRNEVEAIRALGGIVINITRPGYSGDTHASERDLDGLEFDHTIENTGSLVELERSIVELVRGLVKPAPKGKSSGEHE
jgi:hypothetical protein